MRIVFVLAYADVSGGARTVATYARLLAARGHDVVVVSAPAPTPSLATCLKSVLRGRGLPRPPAPERSHVDDAGVRHHRLDRFRPLRDRDVPDADVIVATWWLTAEWIAALSPRKGVKVHFVQGDEADLPGQPRERVERTWTLPLRRIVCSRWLVDLARQRYGDPAVTYVPNGVDLEHFRAPPRERRDPPSIGFVYSDVTIKGCDVALAAYTLVARHRPALRLVAFGSAPVSPRLPLPPGAAFTLRPRQDEIPRIYASCDAWLWPSRREGFGLPLLEAMACGTPVVAAPAGAAPDLVASGGGVLLRAADPCEMSRAVERILALPPPEWRRLSDEARAVAGGHAWNQSVSLFEAALESARAGARSRGGLCANECGNRSERQPNESPRRIG